MKINVLIQKKLKEKSKLIYGGEMLFTYQDAWDIIDECEKYNVVILGMNFWQQVDNKLIEINSTDWDEINTGDSALENTINAARKLLKRGIPDKANYISFDLN